MHSKSVTRLIYSLAVIVFAAGPISAQDSLKVLTLDEFHQIILMHHPVAEQAALLSEQARQELRISRGTFDPVLASKVYRKEYGGKEYYSLWKTTLQVPLWFGPEIKAGFERNEGEYLNPENYTPAEGLSSVGLTVPLGQGLFIDERRATLRQARLMQDITEAERLKLINKLLLEATKDYWDWLLHYRQVRLYQDASKLAETRLLGVRARVQEGDLAAIDTVEALSEWQSRQVLLQEATLGYNNARLRVSTHLWQQDQVPLELQQETIPAQAITEPDTITETELQRLLAFAQTNHPELIKLNLKGEQLELDRRVAADKLKPKLNAEYNLLQSDFYMSPDALNRQYAASNYKVGLSFSLPLFLREERGKLQLTKAKLQSNALETTLQERAIQNSITAAYNDWLALQQQIILQQQMVVNAARLRDGEVIRFQNGESSLFLVNSREMKLLEAQAKLNDLQAKFAKAKTYLYWAAGSLTNPPAATE